MRTSFTLFLSTVTGVRSIEGTFFSPLYTVGYMLRILLLAKFIAMSIAVCASFLKSVKTVIACVPLSILFTVSSSASCPVTKTLPARPSSSKALIEAPAMASFGAKIATILLFSRREFFTTL
ncbi:hypothetical protein D3C76_802600 [compost metagenome]